MKHDIKMLLYMTSVQLAVLHYHE